MKLALIVMAAVSIVACQQAQYAPPLAPSPTTPLPTNQYNLTLTATVACSTDTQLNAYCRVQAMDQSVEWTERVVRTDWAWGDGSRSTGYLTGTHTYPNTGLFEFGVTISDDTGRTAYATGSVFAHTK